MAKPTQAMRDAMTNIGNPSKKKGSNRGDSKLTESQRKFADARKRVDGLLFNKELKALEEDDGYY